MEGGSSRSVTVVKTTAGFLHGQFKSRIFLPLVHLSLPFDGSQCLQAILEAFPGADFQDGSARLGDIPAGLARAVELPITSRFRDGLIDDPAIPFPGRTAYYGLAEEVLWASSSIRGCR